MSYQNKGFWMAKDGGCLTDGEIAYGTTARIEPKRSHQWSIECGELGYVPNKKQAVEVSSSNSLAGIPASTLSPWGSVAGFNSVPSMFSEQLFASDATRSMSFDDRSVASASMGSLNVGRKVTDDPFGDSSTFDLSVSHSLENPKPGLNYCGIRKVKVSEVRDPQSLLPLSTGPSYARESNNVISTSHGYDKVDACGVSVGLAYGRNEEDVVNVGDSYGKGDDDFISMGQSFNKDACNAVVLRHSYKANGSTMSITNAFRGADCHIMPSAENFSKGDSTVIPVGNVNKGDNMIPLSNTYNGDSSFSVTDIYNKEDNNTSAVAPSNNKCESHVISIGHSFDKGDSNIISFGGFSDDANVSGGLLCNYDLLMGQHSIQRSDTLNKKEVTVSNANEAIFAAPGSASRKKEDIKSTKKTPPNNFPSNVRSLLSTGILDEVPVKYIAWSREKELRGIIKGSGYLCGCQSCNFSKVINAYEFERHAGCKTKHPNNHICFENGKTIYGIVQELRNTPQTMLFDVIQTITGSPINQKSFRLWKESFLAATRELQRIYGKDERNQSL